MGIGDFKSYNDLPKNLKRKYKPANERGDFVNRSAIENIDTAHRLAVLENEAFGDLVESIEQNNLTTNEIITKLKQEDIDSDEKNNLRELLFQHTDLAALKSQPIDPSILIFLKESYDELSYSELLSKKIIDGIQLGDVYLISELLKDKKFPDEFELLNKLENDEQRAQAFKLIKSRTKMACTVIRTIKNTNLALNLYAKIASPTNKKRTEFELTLLGANLAKKLFDSGEMNKLVEYVASGVFDISYLKDILPQIGHYPETIISLVKQSNDVKYICQTLKFVADPGLLLALKEKSKDFTKLSKEDIKKVIEYADLIAKALNLEPVIQSLTNLNKDENSEYSKKPEAQNKFVMGIDNISGRYTIAWANIKRYEYHRDIFQRLSGDLTAKCGGYIGMETVDGKLVITMKRSSGDYGNYSRETLEHFQDEIKKTLQESFGKQAIELKIETSS